MPQPPALVSFNVQKTVNTCVVKLKYWGGMPGVSWIEAALSICLLHWVCFTSQAKKYQGTTHHPRDLWAEAGRGAQASRADGVLRMIRCWQGQGFAAEGCLGPGCRSNDASPHCSGFSLCFLPLWPFSIPSWEWAETLAVWRESQRAVKGVYCRISCLLHSIGQVTSGAQLFAFKTQK